MLRRSIRLTVAAAARRHFSTEATAVAAKAKEDKGSNSGRDTLGRRLLALAYAKRSAVITIRKWKEEGHTVQKYQLNRIISELRKLKRYKHALEVCEWMAQQQDMRLMPGDYAVHLDLIAKVRGLNSAEKYFEDLPDNLRNGITCSALLHAYVQNKLVTKAEALMEKMSECGFLKNVLPYNNMISLYIANGQLEKVPQMVKELKKNVVPDVVTYNLLLSAFASKSDVESAEKVLIMMKEAKIHPDWVTYSTLTNLYIKKELLDKAASTLKEMEKRASRKNRASYSSLISLYTSMGDKDAVSRIWEKMKSCFRKLNDAEYINMVSSHIKLGDFEEAKKLYSEWESVSGTHDPRVANVLLAAFINRNQIEEAENFYNGMVERRIAPCYTTFELLAWGQLNNRQMEKVLDYLKKAIASVKKWQPDERLLKEIRKNLEEQGDIERAEKLLVILRNAGYVTTEIYNSLLRTYAKAGKMPLIVAERMKKDGVELNEETHKLMQATSNMCVSEVSGCLS